MRRVLITGVRAKTGAPLADLLSQRADVEVRGGSSDPAQVRSEAITPVRFDWDNSSTWQEAVDGVDALFLVRPDREDAPRLIAALLALTPHATHIVLLSELDGGYFAEDDWAPRTEAVVRDSGRTWTILRPNWFMQVFVDARFMFDELVEHGRLAFPSGGQPVAWIDARDIAAVAAHALLDKRHHGQVYELTGPEALSLPHTAQLLADALARPIEHVELTLRQALADSEGFTRRNDEGAFERIHLGHAKVVTDSVQRVTGRPPHTLAQFLTSVAEVGRPTSS